MAPGASSLTHTLSPPLLPVCPIPFPHLFKADPSVATQVPVVSVRSENKAEGQRQLHG